MTLGYLLFYLSPLSAVAADGLDWFRTEGVAGLDKLRAFYSTIEGSMQAESTANPFDDIMVRDFLIQGSWRLDISKTNPKKLQGDRSYLRSRLPSETVIGINSKYTFELVRRTPDGPYLVKYCGKRSGSISKDIEDKYCQSIFAPFSINFKTLPEWIKTEGFRIESVAPVNIGGRTYANVKVRYTTTKDTKENGDAGLSGELLLDPERYWCVYKANYIMHFRREGKQYERPYQLDIEYGPTMDGMPVPRVVTHTYKFPQTNSVERWTITKVARRAAGEHEFTLSAFGLPEIMEDAPAQPKSRLWVWLLVLGLLTALAAVVVYWRSRRATI
jgi:hypothetical protein